MYNALKQQKFHPSESQEQRAVMDWAAWKVKKWPELALLFHVANGGHRHKATAARLRDEGVKPGVPDLCLPVARRGYHGMYLELKTASGRLSECQKVWAKRLQEQGYAVFVCYGAAEAIGKLEWYFGGGK